MAMDRVTNSFIKKFARNNGYESIKDVSVLFEYFVNYTLVEPRSEYQFDIETINIGKGGTIGIDGFALLLNKQVIDNIEELTDFLDHHKQCEAEIVFVQSKTSAKFDSKEVGGFGFAVNDFISVKQTLKWSKSAKEKIKLFNYFVERISELKDSPTCHLYYVSLGRNENDENVTARFNNDKENLEKENLFSSVHIELVDANDIINKYKKIGQSIDKTFEFPDRVTLPLIKNVKEAYLGFVDTQSIIDLMMNEEGEMLNVFYDNVRDYQGTNKVNNEIAETLISETSKDSFAILNNGITIVAERLKPSRDSVTISNYQIINGCQTSHVLFENRNYIDASVKVPLKLIISEDEEITSKVIRSTNRQTEVKEQDLLAFSQFQKNLEDYYSTFSGDEKLYYERRSKQYTNKNVERKKIIDKTMQIKAIASLYYDKPSLATRYFGAVFAELKDKIFQDNHRMLPYFVAAFALYQLEGYFKSGDIDKKYKKIKYHILTMFKYEINKSKCPEFGSKKSEDFSKIIFEILLDRTETLKLITKVLAKIDSLDVDLEDNEVSKSSSFVRDCLRFYKEKRKKRS